MPCLPQEELLAERKSLDAESEALKAELAAIRCVGGACGGGGVVALPPRRRHAVCCDGPSSLQVGLTYADS
jgi:hypothetical protein